MNPARKINSDTLRRIETFYAGVRMVETESDKPVTARRVIWRLLQEAIQTQKAIKKPGPRGDVSCMPEVYHTPSEIFATEVEMTKDNITYPPRITETPTAQALERYDEVMTWLRYIRGHNLERSRRTVIALAAGVSEIKVMDIFGYPTREAVDGVRYRAIGGILDRLKRDLPREAVAK